MLKSFSIKAKLLTILGIMFALFVGMSLGLFNTADYLETAGIDKTAGVLLAGQQDKIKVASHAMAVSIKGVIDGVTDPAQQIALIRKAVDGIRFEEDQSGYFFVYQGTVCVALPTNQKLQGKDLAELHDKNGVYLVPELRDKAHAGGGFVRYVWPKPGQGDQPKLSYAEMIPGTDFWLGTGIYIDNLVRQKAEFAA
jgi:methyl-accepting chemotaxis protein